MTDREKPAEEQAATSSAEPTPEIPARGAEEHGAEKAESKSVAPPPNRRAARSLWGACAVLLVLVLISVAIGLFALYPDWAARLPEPVRPRQPENPALESRLATVVSSTASLGHSVNRLTEQVDALRRKAEQTPQAPAAPSPPAAPAPDKWQIQDLRDQQEAIRAQQQGIQAQQDALAQRITALQDTLQTVQGAEQQNEELSSRIADIKARLDQVIADQKSAAEASRDVALSVAVGTLGTAVHSGEPYVDPLDAVRHLGVSGDAISALASHAAAGVSTRAEMARRFPPLADEAIRAQRLAAADGWFERTWARLRNLIVARPVGQVAGADTAAILARAQQQLDAGNLATAVREVESLSGAPAETMALWRSDAKARLAVEAELMALQNRLLNETAGRG